MPSVSYPSNPGFRFITTTSTHRTSKRDRQLVKSHAAARGSSSRRNKLGSFTSLQTLPPATSVVQDDASAAENNRQERRMPRYTSPVPISISSDVVWVEGPNGPQPYMVQDVLHLLRFVRVDLYPPEICAWDDSSSATALGFLIHDPLFVHTALFTTEAVLDARLSRPCSVKTGYHLLKTLRLLQERVAASDGPLATADQTIVVVVTLALTAEALDDQVSMKNHVEGLQRMVSLRGGLGRWRPAISDLLSKVCRADLGFALRYGRPPLFLGQGMHISQDYHSIASTRAYGLFDPPTTTDDSLLSTFLQSLDTQLAAVWNDLQRFSALCNASYHTGHRLHAHTFNEMVASILYRLLGLSFNNNTSSSALNEAVRIAMIVFASTVSLRWQRYDRHLLDRFGAALFQLWCTTASGSWPSQSEGTVPSPLPPAVLLWLLTTWDASRGAEGVSQDWAVAWFDETVRALGIFDWGQAREVLGSVVWIGFVHDARARVFFERAFTRFGGGWVDVGDEAGFLEPGL